MHFLILCLYICYFLSNGTSVLSNTLRVLDKAAAAYKRFRAVYLKQASRYRSSGPQQAQQYPPVDPPGDMAVGCWSLTDSGARAPPGCWQVFQLRPPGMEGFQRRQPCLDSMKVNIMDSWVLLVQYPQGTQFSFGGILLFHWVLYDQNQRPCPPKLIAEDTLTLLKKDAITKVKPDKYLDGFYSMHSLILEKDTNLHPILDLKRLNIKVLAKCWTQVKS